MCLNSKILRVTVFPPNSQKIKILNINFAKAQIFRTKIPNEEKELQRGRNMSSKKDNCGVLEQINPWGREEPQGADRVRTAGTGIYQGFSD